MKPIAAEDGWTEVPGTRGILARMVSGDFDEAAQRGFRTRLVRMLPGAETFAPFEHAYWEEVTLIEGALTDLSDGTVHEALAYVIRPPATPHGPLWSERGCVMVETQYFATREVGAADFLDPRAVTQRVSEP